MFGTCLVERSSFDELFADTCSFEVGIAEGAATTTAMKMRINESMNPCDLPQTYIFGQLESQLEFPFVQLKRDFSSYVSSLADFLGAAY